jgi:hypothetical protein
VSLVDAPPVVLRAIEQRTAAITRHGGGPCSACLASSASLAALAGWSMPTTSIPSLWLVVVVRFVLRVRTAI